MTLIATHCSSGEEIEFESHNLKQAAQEIGARNGGTYRVLAGTLPTSNDYYTIHIPSLRTTRAAGHPSGRSEPFTVQSSPIAYLVRVS